MITAVVALHIIVCITMVIVVLLQQGKGADVGAVFGGSSSTVFGASGAGNLLTKITWGCAVLFFSTSIFLAYTSTRRVTGSIFEGRVGLPSQTTPSSKSAPVSGAHPAAPTSGSKTK
ncbi:MAG: preprotein translocase subunit SecG [Deltaproteobacteria bacterium]|nr:preprotein translocase subunit SecG [Deltaproteobacteria bacterium]